MKKLSALVLALLMVFALGVAAVAKPAEDSMDHEPVAYIWLANSEDNDQNTAFGWRLEADVFKGGDYRIFAPVKFEDVDHSKGGLGFVNIYFYDANDVLIADAWNDWAESRIDPTPGEWRVWEYKFEAPEGMAYATVTMGFWNAYGKLSVGSINISSGKEMIWTKSFNGPVDLDDEELEVAVNFTEDDKGVNFDTVYPIEEKLGTNLCLEESTVISLLKYGENIGLTTDTGNYVGQYKGDLKDGVIAIPDFVPEWYGFHLNAAAVDGSIGDQTGRLGTMLVTFAKASEFDRVRLSWYGGTGGIGLPLAIKAYYSDDLSTWKEFGDLAFECEYGQADSGWADTGKIGAVTAKYVKVEYLYEASAWGMVSELEVYAAEEASGEEPTLGEGVTFEKVGDVEYAMGITDKTAVGTYKNAKIYDAKGKEKTTGYIGTGDKIIIDGKKTVVAVINGDIDGDGKVGASDYVKVRLSILKSFNMNEAQTKAACVTGGKSVSARDYVNIRRYILGQLTTLAK